MDEVVPFMLGHTLHSRLSNIFVSWLHLLITFLPEFSVFIHQTFKMYLQHRPCSLLGCLRNSCLLLPMCPLCWRQRKAMPYHDGFPTYFLGWTDRLVSLAFEIIVIALHEREYYFKECSQICQTILEDIIRSWMANGSFEPGNWTS